jgi:hypothetical protein
LELELDEQRRKAGEFGDRLRGLSAAVGRVQSALDLLSNFSEVWEVLVPEERCDLVKLLIERVDVNVPEVLAERAKAWHSKSRRSSLQWSRRSSSAERTWSAPRATPGW